LRPVAAPSRKATPARPSPTANAENVPLKMSPMVAPGAVVTVPFAAVV
jgi:hypothetical protein